MGTSASPIGGQLFMADVTRGSVTRSVRSVMMTSEEPVTRIWKRWTFVAVAAGAVTACSSGNGGSAAQLPATANPAIQTSAPRPTITPAPTPVPSLTSPRSPIPTQEPPAHPGPAAPGLVGTGQAAAPIPTVPTAAGTKDLRTVQPCTAGMISFAPGPVLQALGNRGFRVALTNTSGQACTLSGYPGMAALNGSQVLAAQTSRGSSYIFQDPGPRLVTLGPGAQASFGLGTGGTPADGSPCPTSSALQITLPDQNQSTTVPFAVDVCPPSVGTVTAIQPGADGPNP